MLSVGWMIYYLTYSEVNLSVGVGFKVESFGGKFDLWGYPCDACSMLLLMLTCCSIELQENNYLCNLRCKYEFRKWNVCGTLGCDM